jgi:hypothetical protein
MTTLAPAWASSVPSRIAVVDFPAPPFGDAMTTVGIGVSMLSDNYINRINGKIQYDCDAMSTLDVRRQHPYLRMHDDLELSRQED